MLKLLIFDLDGTLADTSQDITNALNYALKPFGLRAYSVEETKAMVGSGISHLLASLIAQSSALSPGSKREEDARELATKRFVDYYTEHLFDYTKPYPHVRDTLASLKDYRKAVISNKREALSRGVLKGLGLLPFFDTVLGSDSLPEKKPSPVPIQALMKKYAVSPSETVIIGDSNYDVEAGKAAGIKVVGVTYGFRSRDFLKDADIIIDRFDQLPDVLPLLNKTP